MPKLSPFPRLSVGTLLLGLGSLGAGIYLVNGAPRADAVIDGSVERIGGWLLLAYGAATTFAALGSPWSGWKK